MQSNSVASFATRHTTAEAKASATEASTSKSRIRLVDFDNMAYPNFHDYSGDERRSLKLSLMIYKAGQVAGGDAGRTVSTLLNGLTEWSSVTGTTHSDPNFRVGAVPPGAGGFGDSGFSNQFQDDSNQVRHFTFYLAAGYSIGIPAALAGPYANEGTFSSSNPDVALGQVAASLGGNFFGDYRALAQDVWHQVCGQSGDLSLP